MAAAGKLKMPGASSICVESVASRRKNGKFVSRKRSVQCSMGTKLAEKGRKTIFDTRKEEDEVGSPARKAQRLRSVGHNFSKWKVLCILNLLISQKKQ